MFKLEPNRERPTFNAAWTTFGDPSRLPQISHGMVTIALNEAKDGLGDASQFILHPVPLRPAPDGIIAIDAQARITAFNAEAELLTGLAASAALHQPVENLPGPLRVVLLKTLRTGRSLEEQHSLYAPRSEKPLTVRLTVTALSGPEGRILGAVAVLNDIDPLRRLDERLRQFDRLASLGTLSASMAHEIKNALVALRTFVELLVQQNSESKLAEVAGRELQRINSLVSRMLHFAVPSRASLGILHVHEVLDQSLHLILPRLTDHQIVLQRAFRAASDSVRGDASQIEQAFLNLFLNALDATGARGQLTVATDVVPADPRDPAALMLRVSITDTGSGIAAEHRERLFEPFFTTKTGGTGLGLAITRRIVEEHHGIINVESQPGTGSTFSVLLPIARVSP